MEYVIAVVMLAFAAHMVWHRSGTRLRTFRGASTRDYG